MRSIKVIHAPYTSANPYQTLLMESLKKLGVDVKGEKFSQFPIPILAISILVNSKKWKPDIMHLHWQHSFLVVAKFKKLRSVLSAFKSAIFVLQLVILKIMGIKIIWTVHNIKSHENYCKRTEMFFTLILAQLVDSIIAHCETAKYEIQRVFKVKKKEKIVVIPHGNFLNCYENIISREEDKETLGIPLTDINFLFLGEIRYYKGVFELIDAFQKLNSTNANLVIAGKPKNDTILKQLREKISGNENIIKLIPGFVPDNEIQLYINAADVMVFPYREVFTSGGIIMAMSFGKAIIAPYLGCISDTLDNSGSFLYDPSDKNGLLKAMREAVNSKSKMKAMGRHNFELAKKLNWESIAKSTYKVYEKYFQ